MNVVDSSRWLEYVADGPNAGFFAGAIEAPTQNADFDGVPGVKYVLKQDG